MNDTYESHMLHQVERQEHDTDDLCVVEDGEPKSEYAVLVETLQTLHAAEKAINREEGVVITPAYQMVRSAQRYIGGLAKEALRGEDAL